MRNINTIYCDFDGTITQDDAVNTFFEKYASPDWVKSEQLWIEGKISSKENAIVQVGMIRDVTPAELNEYINHIKIDDYFLDFIKYINSKNIQLVILSDGFDLFIKKVLEKHKISNVSVYANHLTYENNKFGIEFPYHNESCDIGAGMCKCNKIIEKEFCYIGDGTSDLCVARKADILFATKTLHRHCEENLINHYYFESFYNIIETLKDLVG